MISIISDIIEVRLYVVFNGWYVMYDTTIYHPMVVLECDADLIWEV